MFTHDMVEAKQPDITMRSIDPAAMEALINFAYSGRITISTSNVQNLMLGANFLQLSRVRDACAEFLQTRLSPANVLGIRYLIPNQQPNNHTKTMPQYEVLLTTVHDSIQL